MLVWVTILVIKFAVKLEFQLEVEWNIPTNSVLIARCSGAI